MKLFGLNIERRETTTDNTPAAKGANIAGSVTYAASEQSSLTVPAFYRAITLRADTMARLRMQYQRRTADGCFTIDLGPTRGKRLNYLLQCEPNPLTNWTSFMRQVEIRRLLQGNAYIYIERDSQDEVVGLWLCAQGEMLSMSEYQLMYYIGTTPMYITAPSRDVIHLRNTITTSNGVKGVPLLTFAARTLNLAATQEQMALDTFSKGGRHKIVLQEQPQQNMGLGKVASKEMENLRRRIEEDLPNNDVLYVPNVASIENISQTFGELELSTMRKLSVADISRLTAVPRALLGDDSNSSYKTPEAAMLDFYNNGIAPQIAEDEDEFNRKLLGLAGWGNHRFHLCEDSLFRLDRQSQALWNKNRMETGVVSINELRAEQELPPIKNGDDHYVSTNLAVAGSAKLTGGEPTTETNTEEEPQ
jgi:HK97 family phage portal protein